MRILPSELSTLIFTIVDGESLFQIMATCRQFARITNQIIREADNDNMYVCLFKNKTLSVHILRLYLNKINVVDDDKIAYLMLAAFASNNNTFLSEIIKYVVDKIKANTKDSGYVIVTDNMQDLDFIKMVNNTHHWKYIDTVNVMPDLQHMTPFSKDILFTNNALFNSIFQSKLHFGAKFINIKLYLEKWIRAVLCANDTDLLCRMYQIDVYEIFYYLRCLKSNYVVRWNVDNYIKKLIYDNSFASDRDHIYKYDYQRISAHNEYEYIMSNIRYSIYALCGGHLTSYLKYQNGKYVDKKIKKNSTNHKLIVTSLLRYNHIEPYKSYKLQFQSDPYFQ